MRDGSRVATSFDIVQFSYILKPLIDKVASEVLLVISVSTIRSVDVFFSAYVKESVNS